MSKIRIRGMSYPGAEGEGRMRGFLKGILAFASRAIFLTWFRLPEDKKRKDFDLALELATNHPELFEVTHEL